MDCKSKNTAVYAVASENMATVWPMRTHLMPLPL